ncbi:MAG: hypothetical protein KJ720_08490 [Proteobacteria bacterium]|nr:hypothetical protein [Pseudomonadota bacterium]MBU1451834.1 hypothetical protein [Pseudomonadota bacterium]
MVNFSKFNKRFLLFVSIAIFCFTGNGLALGGEGGVWRGAKFGMTEAELIKAFPGEIQTLSQVETFDHGKYAKLGIPNLKIGIYTYEVRFIMDGGSNKLTMINIYSNGSECSARYDDLRNKLEAKYGSPSRVEEGPSGIRNVISKRTIWMIPNVSIQLGYFHDFGLNFQRTNVSYEPNLKENNL